MKGFCIVMINQTLSRAVDAVKRDIENSTHTGEMPATVYILSGVLVGALVAGLAGAVIGGIVGVVLSEIVRNNKTAIEIR
jgi:ABC-type lipoprotein release transport system permease subunit